MCKFTRVIHRPRGQSSQDINHLLLSVKVEHLIDTDRRLARHRHFPSQSICFTDIDQNVNTAYLRRSLKI